MRLIFAWALGLCVSWAALPSSAAEPVTPESVVRTLVTANANKDLEMMSRYMAHDADVIGYTIGGRKYVGWDAFAAEMAQEFASVK